jgi:hypothetical protein
MGVEDNKRVVIAYLKSMGAGSDRGLFAEGAKWWFPRLGAISLEEFGKIAERMGPILTSPVTMTIDHITAEGDRVAVEARGHGKTSRGYDYNNVYHFLFFLRDGKITELHEHADSSYAHKIFGMNPTAHLEKAPLSEGEPSLGRAEAAPSLSPAEAVRAERDGR